MRALLVLPLLISQTAVAADPDSKTVRAAIEIGLRTIEAGAKNYPKNRQCFSCHHQALPMMALHSARARGFVIETAILKDQVDFTLRSFTSKKGVDKGQGVGGASTTVGYALTALAVAQVSRDDAVEALVQFLLVRQNKDGSWTAQAKRPPSEGSPFTSTALALFSLKHYLPQIDNAELRKRVEAAMTTGGDWLLGNRPDSTEDRVFHLRGLVALGAEAEIENARAELLKEQLDDGSWAQLKEMKGDAYATGSVLVALRGAGLAANDPAYSRGVGYLLAAQNPAGSWIVKTRSRPIQTFFDNGDLGGESQFISFPATGWAVLALLETIEAKKD